MEIFQAISRRNTNRQTLKRRWTEVRNELEKLRADLAALTPVKRGETESQAGCSGVTLGDQMRGLKRLVEAMYAVLEHPKSSRIEKIECAKVIAACAGVLLPDTSEALLSTRQAVELRAARQAIAEKMQRHKERKRLENRRTYLRRKLRQVPSIPPRERGEPNGTI